MRTKPEFKLYRTRAGVVRATLHYNRLLVVFRSERERLDDKQVTYWFAELWVTSLLSDPADAWSDRPPRELWMEGLPPAVEAAFLADPEHAEHVMAAWLNHVLSEELTLR